MQKLFGKNAQPQVALSWIALLRSMVGLVILSTWFSNLLKGTYTPDGLLLFFSETYPISENPLPFYASFLENVILPARTVFAPFQLVAEGLLGLALLTGTLTQLFSLAGIFFLANTFLASLGHDWPWSYWMPMGLLGVIFLTRAGRALGVDALLFKRYGERGFLLW
jgi:uncharacterized membrane protein YphA (DoxX/SURF4 family)